MTKSKLRPGEVPFKFRYGGTSRGTGALVLVPCGTWDSSREWSTGMPRRNPDSAWSKVYSARSVCGRDLATMKMPGCAFHEAQSPLGRRRLPRANIKCFPSPPEFRIIINFDNYISSTATSPINYSHQLRLLSTKSPLDYISPIPKLSLLPALGRQTLYKAQITINMNSNKGQGVAGASGVQASGQTGGAYVLYPCPNANDPSHPENYKFHPFANRLCRHCQVSVHEDPTSSVN